MDTNKDKNFCRVKATSTNVVLRYPESSEKKTVNGFVVVQSATKLPPVRAQVLAIGPEVTEVKPGDFVVFERFSPAILEYEDGEKYLLIWEKDIRGIDTEGDSVSLAISETEY